ncbi:4-hydroxybenzoate octaprenyltransferase [Plastoroseomonas arctica]|uniref:4-hydroxybenzoate octaprenyltransferase n=1 Tax=Plastoroseomonas arctica TaxID=1509237 RepID=A0AAF1KN95_9PROT|nr:4-hydroxybenzoate octaprenyltransferase [Plastoroseomonas arctica]MBR0656309.1 4-hydroxybenzoate octaprenyltransferase [Plastoroseomonas arctica]
MSGHTDIRAEGWVARLPGAWRPYVLLMRLDRPIGVWLLVLPAFWAFALAAPRVSEGVRLALLFGVGAVLMRGAGCVVNDLFDRDIDKLVERTRERPLASGAVSVRQALVFLVILLVVSFGILVQLNWAAIWLGVCSLVPVALYPLAKRVTSWPQAMLGLTFGWGAPMGYAAAVGGVDGVAALLYAAVILWILGYDTIYAHQDREDDAMVGIGSTALRFGERTRPFLAVCYGLVIVLLAAVGWFAGLSVWYFFALCVPGLMLASQVVRLNIHDPARCLALFKSNRDVGLAVALALIVGRL